MAWLLRNESLTIAPTGLEAPVANPTAHLETGSRVRTGAGSPHPRRRGSRKAYSMARRNRRLELLTVLGYILAVFIFIAGFAVIAMWISRVAAPST